MQGFYRRLDTAFTVEGYRRLDTAFGTVFTAFAAFFSAFTDFFLIFSNPGIVLLPCGLSCFMHACRVSLVA